MFPHLLSPFFLCKESRKKGGLLRNRCLSTTTVEKGIIHRCFTNLRRRENVDARRGNASSVPLFRRGGAKIVSNFFFLPLSLSLRASAHTFCQGLRMMMIPASLDIRCIWKNEKTIFFCFMYLYSRSLDPSIVNCARKLSNKKEFEPHSRKEGGGGDCLLSYFLEDGRSANLPRDN